MMISRVPFPSCKAPGQDTIWTKRKPSSDTAAKFPLRMSCSDEAWQCPRVGFALNWHGHPHAQLHATASSPAMRHFVWAAALMALPPGSDF
jgi:hypothetical protein